MAKAIKTSKAKIGVTVSKRTSIGRQATPKNKSEKRSHKAYRGQGWPR